jgi:hypothetical protein
MSLNLPNHNDPATRTMLEYQHNANPVNVRGELRPAFRFCTVEGCGYTMREGAAPDGTPETICLWDTTHSTPAAPTFATVTPRTVRLSWAAPPAGASSYRVERCLGFPHPYIVVASVAQPTFDDTGLEPGATYYYRVRVDAEDGPRSAISSVSTKPE